MAPLYQVLLLLALHDERGTPHPAAYIALDEGLRAAILADLRVRRRLRVLADGVHPRSPEPTGDALLDEVLAGLAGVEAGPAGGWLDAVRALLPDVRDRVTATLVATGVVERRERDLPDLDPRQSLPMVAGDLEARTLARLREVLLEGGQVGPWEWHLVSLVEACNLIDVHFQGAERQVARDQAAEVRAQDVLGSALAEWVADAEGTDVYIAPPRSGNLPTA